MLSKVPQLGRYLQKNPVRTGVRGEHVSDAEEDKRNVCPKGNYLCRHRLHQKELGERKDEEAGN